MSIDIWERQRDLLVLKKAAAEHDLAVIYSLGLRIERLVRVVEAKVSEYEAAITELECTRGK